MPKKTERGAVATSQSNDSRKKRITQEDRVLDHMRKYGSITSMTAFEMYNITRLSAKIFNLREEGYNIVTIRETSKNGATYGRYVLKEEVA